MTFLLQQGNTARAIRSDTSAVVTQGRFLKSALFFTVLLNMKHIFLYLAPAFFVFLLRNYCVRVPPGGWLPRPQICNTVKLGVVVVGVTAASFGPFVALGQLPQVGKLSGKIGCKLEVGLDPRHLSGFLQLRECSVHFVFLHGCTRNDMLALLCFGRILPPAPTVHPDVYTSQCTVYFTESCI